MRQVRATRHQDDFLDRLQLHPLQGEEGRHIVSEAPPLIIVVWCVRCRENILHKYLVGNAGKKKLHLLTCYKCGSVINWPFIRN